MAPASWAAGLGVAPVAAAPAMADEAPKYGGILTYMIPADSPPNFDAQREETYATIHSAAPFYSVLIRINPSNPESTTDIICDLCTEMPQPADGGKTYTFRPRCTSFSRAERSTRSSGLPGYRRNCAPDMSVMLSSTALWTGRGRNISAAC
jgi:hypothetical protein